MHYAALVNRSGWNGEGIRTVITLLSRVSETTTPKTNVLVHSKMVHVANFVDVSIVCFVDESFFSEDCRIGWIKTEVVQKNSELLESLM